MAMSFSIRDSFLCWAEIPSAADVPVFRVVFIALEAIFSFLFWAMYAKTEFGYGLADMCLWGRTALEYDGLCSHNALREVPAGDFDLTPEELEAKAQAKAQVRAQQMKENHENNQERDARNKKQWVDENRDSVHAHSKKAKLKAKGEQRFSCAVCKKDFYNSTQLNDHNGTKLHADKVATAEGRAVTKPHQCSVCDTGFNSIGDLNKHNKGKKHLLKVAREQAEAARSEQTSS